MDFQTFHDYRRLARRGFAEPLVCPDCASEYVVRADSDTEPYLHCFGCNSSVRPGARLYAEISAVVKEYIDRNNITLNS